MRLKLWIIIVIIMTSFVVTGCTKNDQSIIDEIQNEFPADVQNDGILHAEVMANGLLVFFRSNTGIGAGFFTQHSENWEWVTGSGYAAFSPDNGLSVSHTNMDEISLFTSYGVITNSDISDIQSSEHKAKIVQMPDGTRIWFITYEKSIGQDGSLPPIVGLSKKGDQIIAIPE